MPELPEVETIRRSLVSKLSDNAILRVDIKSPKLIRFQSESIFRQRVCDLKICEINRRGKFLDFVCLSGGQQYHFISHLGMTGAWFYVSDLDDVHKKYIKHVHLIFEVAQNTARRYLVYCDIRKFGGLRIFTDEEYRSKKLNGSILKMGPEPFQQDAEAVFISNARKPKYARKPIKTVILDQEVLAGVGNIYACEILWKTEIHPLANTADLSDRRLKQLLANTREIMDLSISVGGSSISDYMDADGKSGNFQKYFSVYKIKHAQIKHCPTCATTIDNLKIDGRSSYYCPQCQKE